MGATNGRRDRNAAYRRSVNRRQLELTEIMRLRESSKRVKQESIGGDRK